MEPFVVGALLYGKEGKNFENGGGGGKVKMRSVSLSSTCLRNPWVVRSSQAWQRVVYHDHAFCRAEKWICEFSPSDKFSSSLLVLLLVFYFLALWM